ncbi:deleted in malignant brain tumors 1 protein-like [Astyanax mexicanus]|uniref:deleted in malignant brain tumors 1 protein-like n=1 Tax=Astyanax mexicanus TaxID=7994 RepID=UPI0020CAE74C|nr:deleted in malignant brain tumors 1 protein-like [Astyanax mexicanus]
MNSSTAENIRLVSGSGRCDGRVEISINDQWGTVCDDSWDINDADVVCRQMGCGQAISAPISASFGLGSGTIYLDDVGCSGSETTLTSCSNRGIGVHDCGPKEDAGVVCSENVRLVSGSGRCDGRVEISINDQWGTVCDDLWDINDGDVVCRQMGCGRAVSTPQSSRFGPGSGSIFLDDVVCSGSERSLTKCSHRGLGVNNCDHSKDAGVVCSCKICCAGFHLMHTCSPQAGVRAADTNRNCGQTPQTYQQFLWDQSMHGGSRTKWSQLMGLLKLQKAGTRQKRNYDLRAKGKDLRARDLMCLKL